jgi:uncharacterized protein DUF3224
MTLIARFDVNGWDERAIEGLEGGWVGAVQMRKEFTEGITGSSVALFVSSGETEGQRSYFAAERITGATDDGRSGSVTVHHGGLESAPETWFGHVVPGSGTEGWAGWAGSARIEHDDRGAFFTFALD